VVIKTRLAADCGFFCTDWQSADPFIPDIIRFRISKSGRGGIDFNEFVHPFGGFRQNARSPWRRLGGQG